MRAQETFPDVCQEAMLSANFELSGDISQACTAEMIVSNIVAMYERRIVKVGRVKDVGMCDVSR